MSLYRRRHPISFNAAHQPVEVPGHARRLDLRDLPMPPGPYNYRLTGLVTSQLNVSVAASLDFPAVFTSTLQGDMSFYLLDLMATCPEVPIEQGEFTGVVPGLGIRVGIATTKIDSKLGSSIAGVAANTQLNTSQSSYAFVAAGLGPGVIPNAGTFFTNPGGRFDTQKAQDLGQGLQALANYLLQATKDREPAWVYVLAETPKAELSKIQAISASWAINRIEEGKSYNEAFRDINRANPLEILIDSVFVQAIYQRILNNAGDDKPSEAQRQLARSIRDLKGAFA